MPRGNPSPKLAITIDPGVHEKILAAAASDGVSVSAWMTGAAREALQRRAGLAAVAKSEKEHGPFNTAEMNEARRSVSAQLRRVLPSRMSAVVYDAAVLVAADKNDRRTWAEHKVRLELGILPSVPASVVAQVSRSSQQSQLRRFLTGCSGASLGETEAHEAGWLLGRTQTMDVVDAVVVATAVRQKAIILTGDPHDMKRLVEASGREIPVLSV